MLGKGADRCSTLGGCGQIGEPQCDIEVLEGENTLADFDMAKVDAVEDPYRQISAGCHASYDASASPDAKGDMKTTKNEKQWNAASVD